MVIISQQQIGRAKWIKCHFVEETCQFYYHIYKKYNNIIIEIHIIKREQKFGLYIWINDTCFQSVVHRSQHRTSIVCENFEIFI